MGAGSNAGPHFYLGSRIPLPFGYAKGLDGPTAQASTRYATNRVIGYARYIDHQTHSSASIRPLWLRSIRAQAEDDQYSSALR